MVVADLGGPSKPKLDDRLGLRSPTCRSQVEFYIRERFYGAFRRVITLPEGTKASQVTAEVDNGLVEITVRNGAHAPGSTRIALADRSEGPTRRRIGEPG